MINSDENKKNSFVPMEKIELAELDSLMINPQDVLLKNISNTLIEILDKLNIIYNKLDEIYKMSN